MISNISKISQNHASLALTKDNGLFSFNPIWLNSVDASLALMLDEEVCSCSIVGEGVRESLPSTLDGEGACLVC